MIEIEVKGGPHPEALAELIASAINGQPVEHPDAELAGQLVREQQEAAETRRPSWQQMSTLNFQTLEADEDWSEV
jgi:hypothetical protein